MSPDNSDARIVNEREFWKAEYVKRKAMTEVDQFKSNVLSATKQILGKDITTSPSQIYLLNKILLTYFSKVEEGKEQPWFDLTQLTKDQLSSVAYLHEMSIRFGYYAYLIIDLVYSELIIKKSLADEPFPFFPEQANYGFTNFPLPYPKPVSQRGTSHVKTIKKSFYCKDEDSHIAKIWHETNSNIIFCVNALDDAYDHKAIMKEIEKQLIGFRKIHRNIKLNQSPTEEEDAILNSAAKRSYSTQYKPTHYHARAIGLWLWDYIHFNNVDRSEAIKELRKRGFAPNIVEYNDTGESRLRNNYEKTRVCIMRGEVLPVG